MLGQHPEADAELRYGFGCTWYSDHGPFYANMQFAWFLIGLPCITATIFALMSACGLTFCACARGPTVLSNESTLTAHYSTLYGPLLDVSDVQLDLDVDSTVHRWVRWGACGAILYGVLLAVLALFITLHANNEAEFTFLVDALVAFAMFLSKLAVTVCARTVHRHLSPLSRQVAKQWVMVLTLSKALTAACAMMLVAIYLPLAVQGVDANRGDGTRRRLQEHDHHDEDNDHGPTPREQRQLCDAGFFMIWSFLITLISQSVAGFAFFRIYANAVRIFGDPFIFRKVVNCWWGILVVCTCGVGIALWLGSAICVFPALDISPLRMMGLFYGGAAVCQILAGSAMLLCNQHIRDYWKQQSNTTPSQTPATVMGNISDGIPLGVPAGHLVQMSVPVGAAPGMMLQVTTPQGTVVEAPVPEGAAPGTTFMVQYSVASDAQCSA